MHAYSVCYLLPSQLGADESGRNVLCGSTAGGVKATDKVRYMELLLEKDLFPPSSSVRFSHRQQCSR